MPSAMALQLPLTGAVQRRNNPRTATVAQIKKHDVFALLIFNRVDDVMSEFQLVQKEPPRDG
jgi:hypothetical protein